MKVKGKGPVRKGETKRKDDNKKKTATKEQLAVSKWMRQNVPTRKAKLIGAHAVEYFKASTAIDALIETSPWSWTIAKSGEPLIFKFRKQCVTYLNELLQHGLFHRAKKVPLEKPAYKSKKKKEDVKDEREVAKKKKRKLGLAMHSDQAFLDGDDIYVWVYEHTAWYYWLRSTAVVLVAIGVMMFPMWPMGIRKGVMNTLTAIVMILFFSLVSIWILQYVLFAMVFLFSKGKIKFWILPNFQEDVGIKQSFIPLYDLKYTGGDDGQKKQLDEEEEDDEEEEESEGDSSSEDNNTKESKGEEELK